MDAKMLQNMIALHKKSYEIKFDLEGTKYERIENIGSGAYGVVCSAVDKKTKDKVAIKKIPSIFDQLLLAKRTFREIKILKHFKHDNIISIREILTPKQQDFKDIYIVLDLMESDLHRIIHSKQQLTDEHVRYFLYQILRGLKYIHSANVIHRDLKPSNLLVNENCELKIGDFGMARGISSAPEDANHALTLYVATRWYRAPELILSCLEYSEAVDVWSVGCILAEMLGRKQLFPGRDTFNQLQLIISILGAPSTDVSDVLQSAKSPLVKDMFKNHGGQPLDLKLLYPDAPNKAVDLLRQLLTFNPKNRLSVTKGLAHPYLSKYHDPDDEPICIPVFDFDFERIQMNRQETKEAIMKVIAEYQKKPASNLAKFVLKPVPKDQLLKHVAKNQLKVVQNEKALKSVPQSELLKHVPKDQILKPVSKEELVQRTQKPIDYVKNSEMSKESATFIEQKAPVPPPPQQLTGLDVYLQQQHLKNLQEKLQKRILNSQKIAKEDMFKKSPVTADEKTETLKVDASQSVSDVEMLSAKSVKSESYSENCQNLNVEIRKDSSSQNDVVMLSAKTEEENKVPPSVTEDKTQEDRHLDTKARIKEAILKAGMRKQKMALEKDAKPRPITAYQRQKEREEKRKQKQEKAKERKRGKKGRTDIKESALSLTDADKDLLARWKNMQSSTKPFVHPIRNHLLQGPKTDEQINKFPVQQPNLNPVQPTMQSLQSQFHNMNAAKTFESQNAVVEGSGAYVAGQLQLATIPANTQVNAGLAITVQGQLPPGGTSQGNVNMGSSSHTQGITNTSQVPMKMASLGQTAGGLTSQVGLPTGMTTQVQLPIAVTVQSQITSVMSSQSQINMGVATQADKPTGLTVESQLQVDQANDEQNQFMPTALTQMSSQPLRRTDSLSFVPTTLSETGVQSQAGGPLWLDTTQSSLDSLPSYSEALQAKADAVYVDQLSTNTYIASENCDLDGTLTPNKNIISFLPVANCPQQRGNCQNLATQKPLMQPNWLIELSKGVSRSHIEDLTLAQTPKGTGEGYGVGLDIDAIMKEAALVDAKDFDKDSSKLDSAPLSASLLSEMLNMDAAELEKVLKQELGMESPLLFDNLNLG